MKIRVVDYVANLGGGVRFTVQLMRAIHRSWKVSFDVVSHGEALKRYHDLLKPVLPATYCDIEVRPRLVNRILPKTLPGLWRLGLHPQDRYDFQLLPRVLDDCDQAWFPWSHRHHAPADGFSKIVASLHDLILLEFPDFFPDAFRAAERQVQLGWIASDARIVVSSYSTATAEEHPLVLTGDGASLDSATPRGHALARLAVKSGLESGRTLFPIGYVDEAAYDQILAGACAVVMPRSLRA